MSPQPVVLIIAEDPGQRAFLRAAVTLVSDADTVLVDDADTGLYVLDRLPPPVVIVNWYLPASGTAGLLRAIRQQPKLREIPVVLSAHDPEEIPSADRKLADAVVRTAVDLDGLSQVLRRYLPPPPVDEFSHD